MEPASPSPIASGSNSAPPELETNLTNQRILSSAPEMQNNYIMA